MFFWDAFFMKRLTFKEKFCMHAFLFFLIIFCSFCSSSALSALLDNISASAL